MSSARIAVEERMQEFMEACERLGLKVTHQRMEVFRAVVSSTEHPDVLSVYRRVKRKIPTISLDTVYRNLRMLAGHGLLSIMGMSQENLRFDGNMQSHHHFTCIRCGMIGDFVSSRIDAIEAPPEARELGSPLSLHMEVKGICTRCQEKAKKK